MFVFVMVNNETIAMQCSHLPPVEGIVSIKSDICEEGVGSNCQQCRGQLYQNVMYDTAVIISRTFWVFGGGKPWQITSTGGSPNFTIQIFNVL